MAKRKHNSNKTLKGRSRRGGEGEPLSENYSTSPTSSTDQVPVPAPVPDQVPAPSMLTNIENAGKSVIDSGKGVINSVTNTAKTSTSWWWPTSSCKDPSSYNFFDRRELCKTPQDLSSLTPQSIGGKRRRRRTQKKYRKKPNINIKGILKVYKTKNITRKRLHTKRR